MNNKEILLVVNMVSNEKGVDKALIFEALECALASASKKPYPYDVDIKVKINPATGYYHTIRRWQVVAENDGINEHTQCSLADAQKQQPDIQTGDYLEQDIESVEFGRIAAQAARQVIFQKIREAERQKIADLYKNRVGQLLSGTVKKIERGNVIIDLGENAEGLLTRDKMLPRDVVHPNDRLRVYLQEVRPDNRSQQLILSRTAPELLIELFKLEIPEIGEGLIDITHAARDPGARAKVAVKANDPRIDPVGACVGMRGSRIRAITEELSGERIDIIIWDENPAQFVLNAMSPAEVSSIVVDEDKHSMDVAVEENQLSLAIGRSGQNVKLASQLTGWTLNVMTAEDAANKNADEVHKLLKLFQNELDIDEEFAMVLVEEGFSSIEEVAYVPLAEMLEIDGFDEEIVDSLRQRARDSLLIKEIASEEQLEESEQQGQVLLANMEGMTVEWLAQLAKANIHTQEDLAEQAVDDLLATLPDIDKQQAAQLIMTARAPWFAK